MENLTVLLSAWSRDGISTALMTEAAYLCAALALALRDNGSTGGSQDIAHRLGARLVDVPEKGYGNTLRHGMEAALGFLMRFKVVTI